MPQSPLLTVHALTKNFIHSVVVDHDILVDATCGRGHDTLFLAELSNEKKGKVYGFDIQKEALESTQLKIAAYQNVNLIHDSHANFLSYFSPQSIGVFVYNLGYLPGHEKQITTLSSSTIKSLEQAIELLRPLGGVAITCYTGHEEGINEFHRLKTFVKNLSSKHFSVTWTEWMNRQNCPQVILIQKN